MRKYKDAIFFHGTSERKWRRKGYTQSTLYLVSTLEDAVEYAYEAAANDELSGVAPRPVIFSVDARDLQGLSFEPDWGGFGVDERWTWRRSLSEFGSFAVSGNIESVKSKFRRVPKDEWRTASGEAE